MATDGPTPSPCDSEIYRYGKLIFMTSTSSNRAERWVKKLAEVSGDRVDWHYVAGRVMVKYLGDEDAHKRILAAYHLVGEPEWQPGYEYSVEVY